MFTYGRFFICVLVIVCFFAVAWNANVDLQKMFSSDNVAKLKEMTFGDSERQTSQEESPAELTDSSSANEQSVWKENSLPQQDFSNIAITDTGSRPFASGADFKSPVGTNATRGDSSSPNSSSLANANGHGNPKSSKDSISEEWERAMKRVNQVAENDEPVSYQPPPTGNLNLATQQQLADVPPRNLNNKMEQNEFENNCFANSGQNDSLPPMIPNTEQVAKSVGDNATNQVNEKPNSANLEKSANASWALGSQDLDKLIKQPGLNDPNAPPIPPGLDPSFFKSLPKKSEAVSVIDMPQTQDKPVGQITNNATRVANKLPVVKKLDFVGELVEVGKSQKQQNTKPIGFVKHTWTAKDNLPLLAETYLGSKSRYTEILEMNSEALSDPTRIPVGTVLKIPVY